MGVNRVQWALRNDWKIIFIVALLSRLVLFLIIPLDWNSDSYHHWQISYFTLHIGLQHGRVWDLLGSDYYWGMIPHLIQSFLLWFFRSSSINIYRLFNVGMGAVNSVLVYRLSKKFYSIENARWSGLGFALFPVSVIFDSVAMQDTFALGLVLGSLFLIREKLFWSGVLLGLACHSRIEYTLISLIILTGFIYMEKLETDSQPFIFGWITAWLVPSLHIYSQTGDLFYPLHYSLYSVFGGYTSSYKGLPFTYSMSRWVFSRLSIWGGTQGGVLVMLLLVFGLGVIIQITRSGWFRYQPLLFLSSSLIVLSPLVLPYLGDNRTHLLVMLRFLVPIIALGLSPLFHCVSRFELNSRKPIISKLMRLGILSILFTGFNLVPEYQMMQGAVQNEFNTADRVADVYQGGGIVCDIPSMVYRLSTKSGVKPEYITSNLYSPYYYGISDPEPYFEWLRKGNVSIWCYYGERGDPIWSILGLYPELFINIEGGPRNGYYLVDRDSFL